MISITLAMTAMMMPQAYAWSFDDLYDALREAAQDTQNQLNNLQAQLSGDDQSVCRQTRKMDCKESCPSGWSQYGTANHGCCSSLTSCGGNRKKCERFTSCRRRSEVEAAGYTMEILEDDKWVEYNDVSTEVTNPEGMTTIVDEENEVLPEGSENARRRWTYFPGWPSWLYRCRDEMEMPCNMPCWGGWSLVREIPNGCCMNGPGGIDHPKPCGFTTKVCEKRYLCWDRSG